MLDRFKVRQLIRITDHLTYKGIYVIESEVHGIALAYWNNHLVIFTIESDLAIEYENIPDFLRWLKSINKTKYLPLNLPYTFGVVKDKLKISYGANGHIEIWRKRLGQLIGEIEGVYEDWTDYKRMRLRGA